VRREAPHVESGGARGFPESRENNREVADFLVIAVFPTLNRAAIPRRCVQIPCSVEAGKFFGRTANAMIEQAIDQGILHRWGLSSLRNGWLAKTARIS
jgi:hypothetical protein